MIVDNYQFEIYLEGYLIPGVIYFGITETKDSIPRAVISISGNNKSLKLLAGTIVQIFGSRLNQSNNESILLYEGEINSISYSYDKDNGDTVSLNTHSILSQFYSTRLRPSDAIVNYQEASATGIPNEHYLIRSSNIKCGSPTTNNNNKSLKKEYTSVSFNSTSGLKSILTSDALNFSQAMGKNSAGSKGNFLPFIKKVNDLFTQSDILYALNAKSLNLFDSIFLFPNPGLPYYFQILTMLDAIKAANTEVGLQIGVDSVLSIARFFQSFKERLYYRSIALAAPTASNLFYSDVQEYKTTADEPIREYYLPGIESGPPLLANIIFPEEVLNIKFSHDLYGELTRLVLTGSISVTGHNVSSAILPTVVSPDLTYIESGEAPNKTLYTAFTDEELYRGVNLKKTTIDGILNQVLVNQLKAPGESGKSEVNKDTVNRGLIENEGGLATSLQITANRQYIVNKFNTRTIEVSTNWNPNYVIGLPGMVFMDKMPTFVGIVEKVSHQCSTTGSVSTNVVLSSCRIIFDEEASSTGITPVLNPLKDSLLNEESETAIYGGVDYMYNSKLYSFDRMGQFLYGYITTGRINKELFETIELEGGKEVWNEFQGLQDKLSSGNIDYSILQYIKDKESNIREDALNKVLSYKDKYNLEEVPDEIRNGIILKEAIIQFKKAYKNSQELSPTLFRETIKSRNIITKKNYLKFIGGNNPDNTLQVAESDTKDLSKIVNETLNGDLGFLKKILLKLNLPTLSKAAYLKMQSSYNANDSEIKSITATLEKYESDDKSTKITELKNRLTELKSIKTSLTDLLKEFDEKLSTESEIGTDNILSLFKPYNRTRKAHVVEAFKDFQHVFDIIVKGN